MGGVNNGAEGRCKDWGRGKGRKGVKTGVEGREGRCKEEGREGVKTGEEGRELKTGIGKRLWRVGKG